MRKVNVLFMQSQTFFGADSLIHAQIMRYLDRNRTQVYAACNPGNCQVKSASLKALEAIPGLHLRPTHFGTSVHFRSKQEIFQDAVGTLAPTVFSLGGLVQYARKHHIDIVHCTEKPRDAFYGFVLSRLIGARCVIHLHVKAEPWISPLVRWSMKHADALIGVSSFVADSVIAMGFPAAKTCYVLNSLDLSRWIDQAEGQLDPQGWNEHDDGATIRAEFQIPDRMPLLAVVSRLCPWKGHTELLKALAQVKAQNPSFRLLIVGEDDRRATPGHGSYSDELRALTAALGLSEQIIFTGYRRDIPRIMAACDLYTMPSFEEPFGMVYLEAMAMRKPVVALDNGGAREIIEHGRSGLLSLPQDIDALAANILTLLRDPTLRIEMGRYGRKQVEERFSPVQMACHVEQVYQRVLGFDPAVL